MDIKYIFSDSDVKATIYYITDSVEKSSLSFHVTFSFVLKAVQSFEKHKLNTEVTLNAEKSISVKRKTLPLVPAYTKLQHQQHANDSCKGQIAELNRLVLIFKQKKNDVIFNTLPTWKNCIC